MLLVAVGAPLLAQITAPAFDWSLPVFTDAGPKKMVARGSQVQMTQSGQYDVVNMNLLILTGTAAEELDSTIISPAASFFPDKRVARGDQAVRFIGKGVDAIGQRWIYNDAEKKLTLDGNVRVTFNAELKNLLR